VKNLSRKRLGKASLPCRRANQESTIPSWSWFVVLRQICNLPSYLPPKNGACFINRIFCINEYYPDQLAQLSFDALKDSKDLNRMEDVYTLIWMHPDWKT